MTADVQVQEEVVRRFSADLEDKTKFSADLADLDDDKTKFSADLADLEDKAKFCADLEDKTEHVQKPPKVMSMTQIDRDGLRDAYTDVRDDKTDANWAVFKYSGSEIQLAAKGQDFDEFKAQFGDDERAFAYIRLQTGDEMSKRSKFLLVTWVGTEVSPIKKAKMSTDKALVKEILANFAVELTVESAHELDRGAFVQELTKAGGANYGTGIRD